MTAGTAKTAAFLIIGNEILSGRTADVNLNLLARKLRAKGISLREVRVVRDETDSIVDALRALKGAYGFVFTSGGIGPTHDDITSACVAQTFGVGLEINPEARAILESYYAPRGEEITPARLKMATIPVGAELIANKVTGAPAYRLGNVFVLAGVPAIFASMLEEALELIGPGPGFSAHTVRVYAGESTIAGLLERIQERYSGLDLGSYPKMDGSRFYCELVVNGQSGDDVDAAFADLMAALRAEKVEHEEITGPSGAP